MLEEKEPIDIVNYTGGHNDWNDDTRLALDIKGDKKSFVVIGRLNGENKIEPIRYKDEDDYWLSISTNKAYSYGEEVAPRRIILIIPNNKHGLLEIDSMIQSLNQIKSQIEKGE